MTEKPNPDSEMNVHQLPTDTEQLPDDPRELLNLYYASKDQDESKRIVAKFLNTLILELRRMGF